jgi:curved DNA-binding protein CbpA
MDLFSHDEIIEMFRITPPTPDMGEEELERNNNKYSNGTEKIQRIQNAYKVLSKELNVLGGDNTVEKILLRCIEMDHRTLQQSFWGCIFNVMKAYAKTRFDGRNEASVKACEKITKFIEEENIYLPLI